MSVSPISEAKVRAAIAIQSVWRGRTARVKVEKLRAQLLPHSHFFVAQTYVDYPARLSRLSRASAGKTPVYLLSQPPLVFKASGAPANQERFDKMNQAREICHRNGFTHLTIPKARVYENF